MKSIKLRTVADDIAEVFEEFLEQRGIEVPTSIAEMKENGEIPGETGSTIYGCDWGEITDNVEEVLARTLDKYGVPYVHEYEIPNVVRYEIKISYTFDDTVEYVGTYWTSFDAFKAACELAGKEAFLQNSELWEEKPCNIFVDHGNLHIDLHYLADDAHCYYDVVIKQNEN